MTQFVRTFTAQNRLFSAFSGRAATLCLAALSILLLTPARAAATSFCLDFTYRPNPANFSLFDVSIHDHLAKADIAPAQALGKQFYAYISIGEVAADSPSYPEVLTRNISLFGTNVEWNSFYVDMSDPAWADYLINTLAARVVAKGYDGFFLDTVDVVDLLSEHDPARESQFRQGVFNIISGLKAAYPTKKIITNRGFSIFPQVQNLIDGFLVENLFQHDDYTARDPEDVQDLVDALAPVKAAGVPIYAVDYVSPDNLPLANATAQQILALGYNACIIPQEINGTVLAPLPGASPAPPASGYQLALLPGFTLIANQLNRGQNKVADLFPNVPEGTTIYKFDNSAKQFSINTFFAGQWTDPAQTLNPGEGAFFFNPSASAINCQFSGEASDSSEVSGLTPGFNLVSSRTTGSASFEDVTGFEPVEGDQVYKFVGGAYEIYTFFAGAWNQEPTFQTGESFFLGLTPR